MHKYLMEVDQFFGGCSRFEVEAESKTEAMEKAKEYMRTNPNFWGGNHKQDTLRCLKKIKEK